MPGELADTAPSSLSHVVGQKGVIDQVKVALDAAQQDGKPFDHSLLTGGPGLGKSALANVIALEMATTFHEILGQSVKNSAALNALLLGAGDRDVLHVDEAHELPKSVQTALFLALDKRQVFPGGKDARLNPIPLSNFTLLLSTTDENCLLQPLRDRMKIVLRFQFYSGDELATVVHRRVRALGWDVSETIYPDIARRSRGTPRLALRLLQAAFRVCRADGAGTITAAHLDRACQLEDMDNFGLGPVEQKYLELVGNGIGRLNMISSSLGLSAQTVVKVVEPYLFRSGLATKTDDGRRELTSEGRSHLSDLRKNRA